MTIYRADESRRLSERKWQPAQHMLHLCRVLGTPRTGNMAVTCSNIWAMCRYKARGRYCHPSCRRRVARPHARSCGEINVESNTNWAQTMNGKAFFETWCQNWLTKWRSAMELGTLDSSRADNGWLLYGLRHPEN
jgi:hypothetical protein